MRIIPYLSVKNSVVKLDGSKGDDNVNWNEECQQE